MKDETKGREGMEREGKGWEGPVYLSATCWKEGKQFRVGIGNGRRLTRGARAVGVGGEVVAA